MLAYTRTCSTPECGRSADTQGGACSLRDRVRGDRNAARLATEAGAATNSYRVWIARCAGVPYQMSRRKRGHTWSISPISTSSAREARADCELQGSYPTRVHTLSELTGPVYGHETVREHDNDLTIQSKGEPLGERMIVHGHVLDEDGRGIPNRSVELWQANACGRYIHVVDQHPAPLDPNFTGAGRTQSDAAAGYYKFITIESGAYPWDNHHNTWRPARIHFSVFGHSFVSRLVTHMYFPADPLFPLDPIFNSVTDEKARARMISSFDLENTKPKWALCYRFDTLPGRHSDKRSAAIPTDRLLLFAPHMLLNA